jgi:hypothetical protein
MSHDNILKDFIENSNKHLIKNLHNGSSTSIEDFYEKVVLINSPQKEIVEKWHKLLIQYVNDNDAIFFVRRYASAPKKDWTKIRRGFLTEYDCGLKYVFCDNYFAHYFFMMAMKEIVPSYKEFKSLILKRELPYGFMVTSQEKPFQAYKKGKTVNINKAGWKLDHINSVNSDYNFNYANEKKELFPIGNQSDWIEKKGDDYFSRTIRLSPLNIENHKHKVIAHFLRLVHPMNYFLTPQKNRSNFDVGGSAEMIAFVREKNRKKYGELYDEFEKLILIEHSSDFSKTFPEIINFGFNQVKKAKTNIHGKFINIGETEKKIGSVIENNLIDLNRKHIMKKDDAIKLINKSFNLNLNTNNTNLSNINSNGIWSVEPNIVRKSHNLYLVLNNNSSNKIHLFEIPANHKIYNQLYIRNDKAVFRLLFNLSDNEFIETLKHINFNMFYTGFIDYV